MFRAILRRLATNPTTERDQLFYNQVVKIFGTHYTSSVIVGGVMHYYTFLSKEWQRTSSQTSTASQISVGFHLGLEIPLDGILPGVDVGIGIGPDLGFSFGDGGGVSVGFQSEKFKENSVTRVLFRPPLPRSLSSTFNHSLAAWLSQTVKQPVVINQTLLPLTDLLLDYPVAVANHLQMTIDFYWKTGNLPKLADLKQQRTIFLKSLVPVPGLDVVGCGYDIMELVSKQCLFDITYTHNVQWSKVFNGHRSYQVPDRFSIMGTQQLYSSYDTRLFSSYEQFMENSIYLNQHDEQNFVGFGASYERPEIVTRLRNMYKHHLDLAWTQRRVQWYNLSIGTSPKPSLNSTVAIILNRLPLTFRQEDFQKIWKNFFDTYGTHYVTSADFGGMVWIEDYFDPTMIMKYSTHWIKDQIKRFYWFISTSEFNDVYKPEASQDYVKYRVSKVHVMGGQENLKSFHLKEWIQTIKDRPSAISYSLQPLYTLLPLNSPRRKALEEATLYIRKQAVNATNIYINYLQSVEIPSSVSSIIYSASL